MNTISPASRARTPGKSPPKNARVQVTPVAPAEEHLGKLCSTCGTAILSSDTIVVCPVCSQPYHHDCWKEIGGCGTYGCTAAPVATMKEDVPEDVFTPGWTAEKKCPECGSSIIANALVCKVCRASFPTERPMTKEEWRDREYDEKELNKIKTNVIIQFILSTLGCLFFIMLPVNALAAFTDSWIFRVKRLPPTLKVLFYASFAISALWSAIAAVFLLYSMVFS